MNNPVGDHAVVLGGSMAGLLAARVLADAYAQVTIVDRDALTGSAQPRPGVPQGHHAHGLLARGQQILDELFPGFTDQLLADGVPVRDLGELRWYFGGRRLQPAPTGLGAVGATRPVLEAAVFTRVAALPNVTLLDRHDIAGVTATQDGRRVTGVRVAAEGEAERVLDADLVVDATGRGSRTPVWLTELGYQRVGTDQVKIGLSYTTRHYRMRRDPFLGEQSINPVATPEHPRGAFFTTLGDNCSLLSLTGMLGDRPPTDDAGILAYARSLPVPDVYEALYDAEPLNDPVTFRFPASLRRRYERLPAVPDRLLVLGDAVCSFNPVYGQGMTVAAMEAMTLREHLRGGVPQPLAFQRDIAGVIDVPWGMAAGGDLSFPAVEGERPLGVRFANAYMRRLHRAAGRDGSLTATFMRVAGLVDPPQALMRPAVMLRVLRHGGRPAPIAGSAPERSGVPDLS